MTQNSPSDLIAIYHHIYWSNYQSYIQLDPSRVILPASPLLPSSFPSSSHSSPSTSQKPSSTLTFVVDAPCTFSNYLISSTVKSSCSSSSPASSLIPTLLHRAKEHFYDLNLARSALWVPFPPVENDSFCKEVFLCFKDHNLTLRKEAYPFLGVFEHIGYRIYLPHGTGRGKGGGNGMAKGRRIAPINFLSPQPAQKALEEFLREHKYDSILLWNYKGAKLCIYGTFMYDLLTRSNVKDAMMTVCVFGTNREDVIHLRGLICRRHFAVYGIHPTLHPLDPDTVIIGKLMITTRYGNKPYKVCAQLPFSHMHVYANRKSIFVSGLWLMTVRYRLSYVVHSTFSFWDLQETIDRNLYVHSLYRWVAVEDENGPSLHDCREPLRCLLSKKTVILTPGKVAVALPSLPPPQCILNMLPRKKNAHNWGEEKVLAKGNHILRKLIKYASKPLYVPDSLPMPLTVSVYGTITQYMHNLERYYAQCTYMGYAVSKEDLYASFVETVYQYLSTIVLSGGLSPEESRLLPYHPSYSMNIPFWVMVNMDQRSFVVPIVKEGHLPLSPIFWKGFNKLLESNPGLLEWIPMTLGNKDCQEAFRWREETILEGLFSSPEFLQEAGNEFLYYMWSNVEYVHRQLFHFVEQVDIEELNGSLRSPDSLYVLFKGRLDEKTSFYCWKGGRLMKIGEEDLERYISWRLQGKEKVSGEDKAVQGGKDECCGMNTPYFFLRGDMSIKGGKINLQQHYVLEVEG